MDSHCCDRAGARNGRMVRSATHFCLARIAARRAGFRAVRRRPRYTHEGVAQWNCRRRQLAAQFPRRPGVADALAKNPTCPIEVLRPVVRYLSVTGVQDLFEDLDRMSTSPALVAALIDSSVVNAEQHDQLLERQREEPEGIEALLEAAELAEPDAAKRETLLQKISRLRVVERVQMAMKGTREARGVLIRDSCKVVQRAVLQSPQLTAREVESFAGMTSVSDETLRLIAS